MSTLTNKLWRNHGGLHLPEHKTISTQQPVQCLSAANLPELVIPLLQHARFYPEPVVKVGNNVYKGQALAKAKGYSSLPIHASTSGQIIAIEPRPIPHLSGLNDTCIILKPDGLDTWTPERLEPLANYTDYTAERLRQRICGAGIVGLGGAVFPAALKLETQGTALHTLIINGAECEPYITCDDMLMREKAQEIIAGIQIILHIFHEHTDPKGLHCLIGIEDNKPEALQAMQQTLAHSQDSRIQVVAIPTIYPSGGEKQLIHILTGREVPSGQRPLNVGILCHNVATTRAIYRAVVLGEPLISRYVTITGSGIKAPQNVEVPLGMPIKHLIAAAGGYTQHQPALVMGGPMMGINLANDTLPVVKATNCILVEAAIQPPPALPCIRCGKCADVCPVSLLPQQLYWHARARHLDALEHHHLFDCIECGCCSYVCPSHIPLVDYYRFAKGEVLKQRETQEKAELARARHEFRQERLERLKREKAEKLAQHKKASQEPTAPSSEVDSKKVAIQAALDRVKAKKSPAPSVSEDKPA
ncbi:electron transport complex subunit RsxC [Thiolinea disciformis]|uniref:electron transport complex subunit RsxC n=1 Tax=Thiolinea disciformis TaxID=125614 RepID=UPI00038286C7|nr:electron transport complex subunit RsxC [Thiolinea disciformis]